MVYLWRLYCSGFLRQRFQSNPQKPHSTSSQPSQALQSTLRLSLNPKSSSRLTSSEFLNFLQTAIAARALSSGASSLVCPVCERWYEHSIKLLICHVLSIGIKRTSFEISHLQFHLLWEISEPCLHFRNEVFVELQIGLPSIRLSIFAMETFDPNSRIGPFEL